MAFDSVQLTITHIDLTIAGALASQTLSVTHIRGMPDYYRLRGIHKLRGVTALQEVFRHLIPTDSSPHNADWKYLASIRLVCRGWNTAALASPWLWSYIYPTCFDTVPFTQRLALTKGWPLRVVLDYSLLSSHKDAALEVFRHQYTKIQSITVVPSDNPEQDFEHLKLMFGDCSMYSLQEFIVAPKRGAGRDVAKTEQRTKVTTVPYIFRDCFMLHTLDLCDVFFEKGLFLGVQKLRLSKVHSEYTDKDIETVLGLLADTVTLTDLRLNKVFGPDAGDIDFGETPVYLPYLRKISIKDYSFAVWTLMRKIIFPEVTEIYINTLVSGQRRLCPWGPIAEILPPGGYNSLPTLSRVTKLGIHFDSTGWLSWVAFDDYNFPLLDLNMMLHSFSAVSAKDYFTRSFFNLNLFPIHQIHEIAIGIDEKACISYDEAFWRFFLSQFTMLKTLNITGQPPSTLIASLMPTAIQIDNTLPCPLLHTLRIRCLDLPTLTSRALQDMLATRQCGKSGLKMLDFVAPPGPIPGMSRTATTHNIPTFKALAHAMTGYAEHVTYTSSAAQARCDRGDKLWWVPHPVSVLPPVAFPTYTQSPTVDATAGWQPDVEGFAQPKQVVNYPDFAMDVDMPVVPQC